MVGEEVHRRQNDSGKGHGVGGGGVGWGAGGVGEGRKGAFPPTLGGPGNQCPV